MKNFMKLALLITIPLFSCTKNESNVAQLENKFKGAFWMVDQNNLTNVGSEKFNPYDSSLFYLNKLDKLDSKNNGSYKIWKLRLFLKKGYYDSVLTYNQTEPNISSFEIDLLKGLAYRMMQDTINSKNYIGQAKKQLNCNKNDDEKCIILSTLLTNDFSILRKNKDNSKLLNELYTNSNGNIKSLIETLNIQFDNDFFTSE